MVILFDRFNLPEDIFEIIFSTRQQGVVAKALISFIKDNDGQVNKSQMSFFATNLHEGQLNVNVDDANGKKEVTLTYNKRQFYDRILTPMKTMGMIDYDLYKKIYIISTKFKEDVEKIGVMWTEELEKKTHPLGGNS
jgi:hypothetical protein